MELTVVMSIKCPVLALKYDLHCYHILPIFKISLVDTEIWIPRSPQTAIFLTDGGKSGAIGAQHIRRGRRPLVEAARSAQALPVNALPLPGIHHPWL